MIKIVYVINVTEYKTIKIEIDQTNTLLEVKQKICLFEHRAEFFIFFFWNAQKNSKVVNFQTFLQFISITLRKNVFLVPLHIR